MKLLHPEVEITPGRPGSRPSVVSESQPVPGSAVIRIVNPMPQENAFIVRLRCDHPLWHEEWFTITALPPPPGAGKEATPGKQDQRGPQDRWVKTYVPRGGSRDLLLRFDVPQQPESRADRYAFVIEVETLVVGAADAHRRRNRVTSIPGVATIRPYYRWSLGVTPEQQRVGFRRRSADFEVVITNEGNDWIYCDLQMPRPRDMVLDSPTQRMAVPPPEPGETILAENARDSRPGTQRSVPVHAVTHLRTFKGERTPQPLLLSAVRLDAPSVPPPPSDENFAGAGSVVANPTTESRQAVGDCAIVYCPPVPAKLTDLFRQGVSSIRVFIMSIVGFALLAPMMYVAYEQSRHSVSIVPMGFAYPGRPLVLGDKWVLGTRVTFAGKVGDRQIMPVTVDSMPVPGKATNPDRAQVVVPSNLNHMTGTMTAQRFAKFIPWPFSGLMPKSTCPITVGDALQPPTVFPVTGQLVAGKTVTISGTSLGDDTGSVRIGDKEAKVKAWSPGSITVTVPDLKPAASCPVIVTPSGGSPLTPTGGALPSVTTTAALNAGKQSERQAYSDRMDAAQAALNAAQQDKLNFELDLQKKADSIDKTNAQAVADFNNTYVPMAKLKEQTLDDNIKQRQKSLDEATAALKKFDAGAS